MNSYDIYDKQIISTILNSVDKIMQEVSSKRSEKQILVDSPICVTTTLDYVDDEPIVECIDIKNAFDVKELTSNDINVKNAFNANDLDRRNIDINKVSSTILEVIFNTIKTENDSGKVFLEVDFCKDFENDLDGATPEELDKIILKVGRYLQSKGFKIINLKENNNKMMFISW